MKRRTLINFFLLAAPALTLRPLSALARSNEDIASMQKRWAELLPPGFKAPQVTDRLSLEADEWRARLSPLAYDVLRKEATERPFTSKLNDEKREGVFLCAGCDLPLFSSEMKYDSGTGWPSFFTPIPGAMETKRDYALIWPRTEYHCGRCGGHQGHIFDDGPRPTGERWCNNGVALHFLPSTS